MSQLSTQQECPGQLFSLIKDNKDAVKISPRKFKYIHSALSHFIHALPLSNSIQVQGSHHYLCAARLRLGLSSEKLTSQLLGHCYLDLAGSQTQNCAKLA